MLKFLIRIVLISFLVFPVKIHSAQRDQKPNLSELIIQLQEQNKATNRHLELLQHNLDLLQHNMDKRFEQVDKRFEQIDKRFEQVDKRFDLLRDEMNNKFSVVYWILGILLSAIGSIFVILYKHTNRLTEISQEIKALTERMDKHISMLTVEKEKIYIEHSLENEHKAINFFLKEIVQKDENLMEKAKEYHLSYS